MNTFCSLRGRMGVKSCTFFVEFPMRHSFLLFAIDDLVYLILVLIHHVIYA